MIWTVLAILLLTASAPEPHATQATPGPTHVPAPASAAATDFVARLTEADAKVASVKTLRARFEQSKATALLKRPLRSSGTIVTRGGSVMWTTTTPRPSQMLVTPTSLSILYPQDKRLEVFPVGADLKDLAGAPLPRVDALRDRFEIGPMPLAELGLDAEQARSGEGVLLGVRLTPRSAALQAHVRSVGVLIDPRIPAATRVVIIDPEGDRTELTLLDVQVNVQVDPAEVTLEPPPGTTTTEPLGPVKPR